MNALILIITILAILPKNILAQQTSLDLGKLDNRLKFLSLSTSKSDFIKNTMNISKTFQIKITRNKKFLTKYSTERIPITSISFIPDDEELLLIEGRYIKDNLFYIQIIINKEITANLINKDPDFLSKNEKSWYLKDEGILLNIKTTKETTITILNFLFLNINNYLNSEDIKYIKQEFKILELP